MQRAGKILAPKKATRYNSGVGMTKAGRKVVGHLTALCRSGSSYTAFQRPRLIIPVPLYFYKGGLNGFCVVLCAVWGFALRRLCCFGGKVRGAGEKTLFPRASTVGTAQRDTAGIDAFPF